MPTNILPGTKEFYANEFNNSRTSIEVEFVALTKHLVNSDMPVEDIVELMGHLIEAYEEIREFTGKHDTEKGLDK